MTLLDTRYTIETPEGIDLALCPAGPIPRALAYLVDFLLRAAILVALFFLPPWDRGIGEAGMLIAYFLLEWFYPVVFEVYRGGMTPGKKSLGIHVINDDGTPVGWGASLIRNLLRVVDLLPFAYVGGLVSMLVARNFKRLGDLAAGTLVVHHQAVPLARRLDVAGARPLPVSLTLDERRALLDFSESVGRLSPQRQQELANILTPLSGRQDGEAVAALARFANTLTGRE